MGEFRLRIGAWWAARRLDGRRIWVRLQPQLRRLPATLRPWAVRMGAALQRLQTRPWPREARLAVAGGLLAVGALAAGWLGYRGVLSPVAPTLQLAAGTDAPPPFKGAAAPAKEPAGVPVALDNQGKLRVAVAGLLPAGLQLPSEQLLLTDDDPAEGQLVLFQGEWLQDTKAVAAIKRLLSLGRPVVLYAGGLPNGEFLPPAPQVLASLGVKGAPRLESPDKMRALAIWLPKDGPPEVLAVSGEDTSPRKGIEQALRQLLTVMTAK